MSSPTFIANLALSRIGHAPIDDLGENSPEAIAANSLYEGVRDYVLGDFPWGCCSDIQVMAEMTNDRTSDWAYKYQRPTCLRFCRVWPSSGKPDPRYPIAYERRPGAIYTDQANARALIVVSEDDVTRFSPALISCIAYRLGAELCMPLGKDNNVTERMISGYETEKSTAWRTDANEDLNRMETVAREASWIAARG